MDVVVSPQQWGPMRVVCIFFFSTRRRHTRCSRDWSSDVCSSDLGQFIDDVNKLLENVLCMARHPTQDLVAYGGDLGVPRISRISDNQGRTAANNDEIGRASCRERV